MLRWNTTSKELFDVLTQLMLIPELNSFRLVGGTALSLLLGHRESVDIDLFSDNVYGQTFFNQIYSRLKLLFPIVEQAGPLGNLFLNQENNLGFPFANWIFRRYFNKNRYSALDLQCVCYGAFHACDHSRRITLAPY